MHSGAFMGKMHTGPYGKNGTGAGRRGGRAAAGGAGAARDFWCSISR